MNTPEPPRPGFRFRRRYVVIAAVVCLPVVGALAVTSYFRLSSETKALRQSLMSCVPGQWDKKFAVHVGGITMGFVRVGSRFVHLPPEPRAALEALHGAEVGVYELSEDMPATNAPAIFRAADKAMNAHGWQRIVGVVQARNLVGVYIPCRGFSAHRMSCCVAVLHERDLVVASARGNVAGLLELAGTRLETNPEWHEQRRTFHQFFASSDR
jgi:hypothetical protein